MLVLKGPKKPVRALTFSPDGSLLASASGEGFVRLWNALDGQALGVLAEQTGRGGPDEPLLRFAPNGRHLVVSGAFYALSVWDVQERKLVKQLVKPANFVCEAGIGFASDGRLLAARSDTEQGLWAWDSTDWKELRALWRPPSREEAGLRLLAVEPGGGRAALGNGLLLDVRTGTETGRWGAGMREYAGRGGSVMAWCPKKSLLAVSNRGKTIEVIDPDRGASVTRLTSPTKYYEALAFTSDGRHLLTVSNDKVARFYDTGTWEARESMDWRVGALKSVAVTADGSRAAAGGGSTYTGKIVIWDLG
jgi:WD40 repeat protein